MTSPLVIQVEVTGQAAQLEVESPAVVVNPVTQVVELQASRQGAPGPEGPEGPVGPAGPFEGTAWWYGAGPPTTVIGSKPGDFYVDANTGTVYQLG